MNKSALAIGFVSILGLLILMNACTQKEQAVPKEVVENQAKKEESTTNMSKSNKTILCFGNSLTAGYGLDENLAWPYLLQQKLADLDLPYTYTVVNAGLSGETSAGGLGRIDWVLSQPVDIFILELGANDMLRGLDVTETRKNLFAIIDKVKEKYPKAEVIVAGMLSPPNMGIAYENSFNAIYPDLAKTNDSSLIPFFLNRVAQVDSLNLDDGKHPNELGQKIVLANVWETLKELI